MTRFVFCDFEAKRTNVTCAQPLQFAAIVTDENFHILNTENWRYRITPHILPAPYALKVTNLTTEQVIKNELQAAFEFAQNLYAFLEVFYTNFAVTSPAFHFKSSLAYDIHSSRLTSSNFAAIVGFFRVNLLTETSCALSLASRRFLSVLNNASLVFCR